LASTFGRWSKERVALRNLGEIEAHSGFLGFARNDKKERIVEREMTVAKG
jgi:hypothetical protein